MTRSHGRSNPTTLGVIAVLVTQGTLNDEQFFATWMVVPGKLQIRSKSNQPYQLRSVLVQLKRLNTRYGT